MWTITVRLECLFPKRTIFVRYRLASTGQVRCTGMVSDALPQSALTQSAMRHVRAIEAEPIFNHSVRTFLYARASAAAAAEEEIDLEALFVACLFHDAGTATRHDGSQRFEVEGADAAVAFLRQYGWERARMDAVWEAIALHTSPGIAERRGPIARYTRLGVRVDFGTASLAEPGYAAAVEAEYPRLDVERTLSTLVVNQALHRPAKAPAGSWPGALVAAHRADPGNEGLNPAF